MLTKNEITALNLSPTKKDFVQIWNELLEVAGRLSERWDPTSTNESDPGIVILKALTGIADKLNYNIDKNTLEAFMPTAAQEDSMRKLCDMLGYNIKYYRSAETTVTIKYHNSDPSESEETALSSGKLYIPKFTVITNSDQDVSYFTINQHSQPITTTTPVITVKCMEGQIVRCESTTDNGVITASQISENNRFYLPEAQVAENGIFVYNVFGQEVVDGTTPRIDLVDGTSWEKVDNLNVQVRGSRVFKFGYDSYKSRPYIEFPEDYSELINDGLFIYYARTSGANGNVSPGTLTQIELPTGGQWANVSTESFSVENAFAATTGANIETIKQAYNNFKKTVGTFETLVTCRDYMNKIYTMTDSGKPLVSNILVTDIRNDLNRAITICSCDDAGIFYKEMPLSVATEQVITTPDATTEEFTLSKVNKPVYSSNRTVNGSNWFLGSADGIPLAKNDFIVGGRNSAFNPAADGYVEAIQDKEDGKYYWHIYQVNRAFKCKTILQAERIKQTVITERKTVEVQPAIDHFDLVLYPFKSYNQIRGNVRDIQEVYDASFKYSPVSFTNVKNKLEALNVKTIAHNIVQPREHDIISINNYLRLSAIIGTNSKVTTDEGTLLIENIKIALANAFNMHELDFGEEIPFESIVEVIEKADSRIKIVSLNEPALYTTFSVFEGYENNSSKTPIIREYAVASDWLSETSAISTGRFENTETNSYTFNTKEAKKIYNKLAVRNVLSGRVPLFKYNTTFKTDFSEGAYCVSNTISSSNKPVGLAIPTLENPFTVLVDDNKTYTGEYIVLSAKPTVVSETNFPTPIEGATDPVEYTDPHTNTTYIGTWEDGAEAPTYAKIVYTETAVPEEFVNSSIIADNNITSITTSCKIKADTGTKIISNVTLADSEFVKFRAPNFTTKKTYPAYVNYHLKLNRAIDQQASPANADSIFDLLNINFSSSNQNSKNRQYKWQAVLDYFNNRGKMQTFTLTQSVSKVTDAIQSGTVNQINLDDFAIAASADTPLDVLSKSGCVKMLNDGKPILTYADGSTIEQGKIPISIFEGQSNYFITNATFFDKDSENSLQQAVATKLSEILAQSPTALPTDRDWNIAYEFAYVPFDGSTLADWQDFIRDKGNDLFGFTPVEEGTTILWSVYGTGYADNKYIVNNHIIPSNVASSHINTSKLIPFESDALGSLDNPLQNIYIAASLGSNSKANTLNNNEEYMLRQGEYLYIEYTPSSTTEEGSVQELASVKEILGHKTIIKPVGFEQGLMDSTEFANSYNSSAHKQVAFSGSSTPINMFSLGANEQIEIRDFSQVVLNKDSFADSSVICLYKNFNNCNELEVASYTNGARVNNTYTLKDGEYIFYTDKNKSELAFFTTGTEVTLNGKLVLPKFDIIDLATIFDSSLDEIPWVSKNLSTGDSIAFQEFQYITIGPEDTLECLSIEDSGEYLDENWRSCNNVEYRLAGTTESLKLPKIDVSDEVTAGNGWEAASILELAVSQNTPQTLRKTDKVETSVILHQPNSLGDNPIILKAKDAQHPLSFKTNLPCQSSVSKISINDIYNNPNKADSFELKVFAQQTPAILQTHVGTILPYHKASVVDSSTKWVTTNFDTKSYGEVWNSIALAKLAPQSDDAEVDATLRLSANILPNTYGIFSIYFDLDSNNTQTNKDGVAWISLLPGASTKSIELFNGEDRWTADHRFKLKPGINCIRVNKTCDIYIKASQRLGAIYFDDLQLVDATPIKYTEEGQEKELSTLGLNLSQIGYLDTTSSASSQTFNAFDMRIRRKLRDEYRDNALAALDTKSAIETETSETCWEALIGDKTKLEKLVAFLSDAKEEVKKLNASTHADLFVKYKAIYNNLEKNETLKNALDQCQNLNDLEMQLISLLDGFTDIEASRQDILTKVEQLKETAEANADNFTEAILRKGDILDDFEATASTALYTQLAEDIKFASRREINNRYNKQLEILATDIENVLKSETAIVEALSFLHTKKHQVLLAQIEELVKTYTDSLNSILTNEALQAALGEISSETGNLEVDYSEVASLLEELKDWINSADLRLLVARIESTAGGELYVELAETVDALKQLLETHGINNEITEAIDGLLNLVAEKVTDGSKTFDPDIADDITSVKTDVNEYYADKLSAILDNITITLDNLSKTYTKALSYLNGLEDEQIAVILSRLETITNTSTSYLAIVDLFGTELDFNIKTDYATLPFGEAAVLATWPEYMRQALIEGINQAYQDVRDAAKNTSIIVELTDSNFYSDAGKLNPRPVLIQAANLEAFRELFSSAKILVNQDNQVNGRKEIIEALSDQIAIPNGLNIDIEDDALAGRDAVIYDIISQLKNSATSVSVTEKQQLITRLKDELDKAIYFDTQLEKISASLLCPSILVYESELPADDDFYDDLKTYANNQRNILINTNMSATSLGSLKDSLNKAHSCYNSLLTMLIANSKEDVINWEDLTREDLTTSLLASDFNTNLLDFKTSNNTLRLVDQIRECSIFDFLEKDFVIAWEGPDNTWLDSSGQYYKKYITVRDSAGNDKPDWYSYDQYTKDTSLSGKESDWKDANGNWKTSGDELVSIELQYKNSTWYSYRIDPNTHQEIIQPITNIDGTDWYTTDGEPLSIQDEELEEILNTLFVNVSALAENRISSAAKEAYALVALEEDLLNDIREIDRNNDFYYNVPVEANVAIDFNESDDSLNTLMNPAVNYDINNINNPFVISKLDINYLTKGLQIARSSKLN